VRPITEASGNSAERSHSGSARLGKRSACARKRAPWLAICAASSAIRPLVTVKKAFIEAHGTRIQQPTGQSARREAGDTAQRHLQRVLFAAGEQAVQEQHRLRAFAQHRQRDDGAERGEGRGPAATAWPSWCADCANSWPAARHPDAVPGQHAGGEQHHAGIEQFLPVSFGEPGDPVGTDGHHQRAATPSITAPPIQRPRPARPRVAAAMMPMMSAASRHSRKTMTAELSMATRRSPHRARSSR
jgi:hypothetical protein